MRKQGKMIAAVLAAVITLGVSTVSAQASLINSEPVEVSAVEPRASIPQGAYRLNLNINGRSALDGMVFNLGGITYVPLFRFAASIGKFNYSYNGTTKTARVSGENLEINATVGKLYIEANQRYFYTSRENILHNGEIYVPISPICKALSSTFTYNQSNSTFYVKSGDTRRLSWGSQIYREDQVYWLARIIFAESRGEPMKGKIAVGNVVLNRVRSSAYPNTIYGVIFDKRFGVQFAPVANGTIYNTPNADSIIAAKICLEGYTLSDEIIYFLNPAASTSSWITNNRPYAFTIGKHSFYK
jgi:N-acetylmuramoyl-L-alanine amidase